MTPLNYDFPAQNSCEPAHLRLLEMIIIFAAVIDTPDVYFVVSCPKLRPKVKFSTITKKNQPTGKINESFNFVLSEDKHQEEFPIKVRFCLFTSFED